MRTNRGQNRGEKLNFALSMSDVMSGVLFIFIIILIFFMLRSQKIEADFAASQGLQKQILIELQKQINMELKKAFKSDNYKVEYIESEGVLRLPEKYFFKSGDYELYGEGLKVIQSLKHHIYNTLSCKRSKIKGLCENGKLKVESFYIAGHTDCDPVGKKLKNNKNPVYSNIHLSSMRAISAYDEFANDKKLRSLKNLDGKLIFSVAGYGETRPTSESGRCAKTASEKAKDRRIEFKIVMHLPHGLTNRNHGRR